MPLSPFTGEWSSWGDPALDDYADIWGDQPGYVPSRYAGLKPTDALAAYYGQRRPEATAVQMRGMMGAFDPMYGGYQAMGWGNTPSFGDWVSNMGASGQTGYSFQDLAERAADIAGYSGTPIGEYRPAEYELYYGQRAAENQQRLAQTVGLMGMGGGQWNPAVQQATASGIARMYQGYLGTEQAKDVGAEGFLKYYMQRRFPGSMAGREWIAPEDDE